MRKQNKIKKLVILILLIAFIFSPFNFSGIGFSKINNIAKADMFEQAPYAKHDGQIDITGDVIWTKDMTDLVFNEPVHVMGGVTLTIEKGTTIKFEQSSGENGPAGIFVDDGKLIVNGTQDEHVKFTSDQRDSHFILSFEDQGQIEERTSLLRYAEISKGGVAGSAAYPCFFNFFIQTAYAQYMSGQQPVLSVTSGNVHIENSLFYDNAYADVFVEDIPVYDGDGNFAGMSKPKVEIVNSNFYDQNAVRSNLDCTSDMDCGWRVYLKDNWYGNSSGPTSENASITAGSNIYGRYKLDSFRENDWIVNPVIVVPGILSSAPKTSLGGQLVLDPILHTYDNLMLSLEENGYQKNINLFDFPYEWRDSNVQTADLLKQKIDAVKNETKISKVDLVAHSMGGLVARYYIESTNYQDDVNQLITLGTPHHGAPKDYLTWEAGEVGPKFEDWLMEQLFQLEAAHATGSPNLKNYIQSNVKSVQDLLPDYDYLKEAASGKMRSYHDGYPRNSFLELLNKKSWLDNLQKVDFTNIVGELENKKDTISGFKVVDNANWADGMPEDYGNSNSGIKYGKGDETVPLESSEDISANEKITVDAAHADLPTEAQCKVIEKLTGIGEDDCEYVDTAKRIAHILTFGVFSPIDIQIIAPDGVHWTGKKIDGSFLDENQIDGAYYTGYDTDNEFVTIPNPEDGKYRIIKQGTGDGEYKVEMANISEDENNSGQASENVADVTGVTEKDKIEESVATVSGDNVTTGTVDTTPPVITATVLPEANGNGWNNSDVTVHFDATDDSGIKSVTPDVTLSEEKENQSTTGTAEDNAGNVSNKIISGISIDKTAPTTVANLTGTKGNNDWYTSSITINFSATDSLSGVDKTFYTLDGGSSQNRNVLTINNDGTHQIKYYSIDNAGNVETEKTKEIKIDKTAPTVQITSPKNTNYQNTGILPITYIVNDSQNVADKLVTKVFYDGNAINQSKIDLSLEKLGTHTVAVMATDAAGNQTRMETKFIIITSLDAMSANISHYFNLGLISKFSTRIVLEVKLRNIQEMMKLLSAFQSHWMPQWAKERVIENLKQNINRQIDDLENQIQRDKSFQKMIDLKVQIILLEGLEAVRTH